MNGVRVAQERRGSLVLAVDDEPDGRALVSALLDRVGYRVVTAASGEEALDWVATADYDAIVLDVMLPGIDGLEVCRRLCRANRRTPVLLLTARDAVRDRVAGLDAGADDYLIKPFAFAELAARLRALARPTWEDSGALFFQTVRDAALGVPG